MPAIKSLQIIGSKSFGGAERWFQRFSQELAVRGHPTELAVRRGYDLETTDWGGLACHPMGMHTVWDPWSRWRLARLIRQLRPAIVQTYMGRATRLTRLEPGAGVVHLARLGGYYKLAGYRHAHAWVGNTKGICDYLIREGFPHQRVFQIYNFFEPQPAEGPVAVRQAWGIPADARVLMSPGRLIPVKGHRYLLRALSRLPRESGGRPLYLMILGDGPLGAELKALTRALGIQQRVVWAGWQAEPAPFYRMADMILFPSLERETFGNVILEAWAFGRPLVTAGFRGAREIVQHGQDALMVPCEDADALAAAVRHYLADPALMRSVVEAGRRRLAADFAKERVMRQYIDLYTRLSGR